MLFCSLDYLVFFAVIFCLYWAMPWARARVWLLVAASFYFYATWNPRLALLIFASTLLDFLLGLLLERCSNVRSRKALLTLGILAKLGMLGYFKYADFFLGAMRESLHRLGFSASIPTLEILAPIGISFYTFEAINYLVDIYRAKIRAERNLPNFLLFIAFFPHLVAGPIVRAKDFLPQIERPKRWDWARMNLGVQFILMGMFKKLAIADRMASLVDPVFDQPTLYASHTAWIALFAYAIQIYCDFSGYTDMALGSAHLLGYKLTRNFNMPYLARNVAEFWRRWHISLSTWLRDYLFIPLGGSRGSEWNTRRNLLLTMTLGGLWHGASWNFILWGVLHGFLLIAHRALSSWCKTWSRLNGILESSFGEALRIVVTVTIVALTWIPFRCASVSQMTQFVGRLFQAHPGYPAPSPATWIAFALALILMIVCHWVGSQKWFKRAPLRMPAPMVGFSYAAVFYFALLLVPASGKAFIYFQF